MKKPYFIIDNYYVGLAHINIGRRDDNFMRLCTNHNAMHYRIESLGTLKNGTKQELTGILEQLAIESGEPFIPVDVCTVCGSLKPQPEWTTVESYLVCGYGCKIKFLHPYHDFDKKD